MVIQYAIDDFPEELFSGMFASNSSTDVGDISEEFGPRFTFQALRRLRSKTLIERGLPIKQYQEEMGHSYKTAMEHYLRYRPEEVLDMLWLPHQPHQSLFQVQTLVFPTEDFWFFWFI